MIKWLGVFLLMSGCIGGVVNENSSNYTKNISVRTDTLTLNFIGHWLYQGKRENLIREIANEFEFLNQECKVNLKFPEEVYYKREVKFSEEEFVKKELLAEHSTYDIIRINGQYEKIAQIMNDKDWTKKYLVDFSEYPEFIKNSLPELVNDSAKVKWHGIIPGPALEGYSFAIWYNKELAKEMGLTIKQFGMTYDDLLQYIKEIDAYNKSHNTEIVPIHDNFDWSTINVLVIRLFLSELDDLKDFKKETCDDKKLNAYSKTLKAVEELAKYNTYPKNRGEYAFDKTVDFPLKRKCFFYVNATWMYNYWEKVDAKEVNNMIPCELPVFKPNDIYFGGYSIMWAVPKNAPHKDAAIKFLMYTNTKDIADKWSRYTKCPTGIIGSIISESFGNDQFEDFTFNINKKYGSNKLSFDYIDEMYIVGLSRKDVNVHMVDVATGIMGADEAMSDIRKQLKHNIQLNKN